MEFPSAEDQNNNFYYKQEHCWFQDKKNTTRDNFNNIFVIKVSEIEEIYSYKPIQTALHTTSFELLRDTWVLITQLPRQLPERLVDD